jgi:hypothetical protein
MRDEAAQYAAPLKLSNSDLIAFGRSVKMIF